MGKNVFRSRPVKGPASVPNEGGVDQGIAGGPEHVATDAVADEGLGHYDDEEAPLTWAEVTMRAVALT